MSKCQAESYLRRDPALKKLGYGHFQSVNTGWDLPKPQNKNKLSFILKSPRGGGQAGWNRFHVYMDATSRCHDVMMGHVTIIVTPRKCDVSLEFMPLSHGAAAGGGLMFRLGFISQISEGLDNNIRPPIGWAHLILLPDWLNISNVLFSISQWKSEVVRVTL